MRILFLTGAFPNPQLGGIEAVTYKIAEAVANRGDKCYSCYCVDSPIEDYDIYDGVLHCSYDNPQQYKMIADYVILNKIDIIINQIAISGNSKLLKKHIGDYRCKIISTIHTTVDREIKFMYKEMIANTTSKLKFCIKFALYPLMRLLRLRKLHTKYWQMCEYSDAVVLLSPSYIPIFNKTYHISSPDFINKISAIPNVNKYKTPNNIKDIICNKKKEVLVLSRLEEFPKRISHVIKAWDILSRTGLNNGWKLRIVGYGKDENRYKQYVSKRNIKNIYFEGRQDPQKYLEQSSILVMTSILEGFGMTLSEAQVYGVVPICYETTPAFHDIIEHNKTGVILKKSDYKSLAVAISSILSDNNREIMAVNAVHHVQKFSEEPVINMWYILFNELTKDNVEN